MYLGNIIPLYQSVTSNTVQTNTTHKLYTFMFYFLRHVSVIHICHRQVEKYSTAGRVLQKRPLIHIQSAKNTLHIIPKREICTKIQHVINEVGDSTVQCTSYCKGMSMQSALKKATSIICVLKLCMVRSMQTFPQLLAVNSYTVVKEHVTCSVLQRHNAPSICYIWYHRSHT